MPVKTVKYIILCIITLISFVNNDISAQQVLCPPNLDFEDGTYANWEFFVGFCCPVNTSTPTAPINNRHELTYGIGYDKYGKFPTVAPGGGKYSLKLGNDDAYSQAERVRYYIKVPSGPNAYSLIYRYAVVFQDPGHAPADQPKFEVNVYDSATGQQIACNHHLYVANSNLPGFKKSKVGTDVYYKEWTTASIDFTGLSGHTVAIDFTTADCGQGGHFGYGYLDLTCGFFQVFNVYCNSSQQIDLKAPPGFQKYEWWDASFTKKFGSTENISIPTPTVTKQFAVILTPYAGFGCSDTLFSTVLVSDLITHLNNDTIICKGNSVQLEVKNNNVSMPLKYTWTPSTGLSCTNCYNPIATPGITTKYHVVVEDTTGCSRNDSVTIVVRDAVKSAIVSDTDSICQYDLLNVVCPGPNPIDIQYIWGVDSGAIVSGDGTYAITAQWEHTGVKHVTIKTVLQGCIERDTIDVFVKPKPVALVSIQPDACIGDPVKMNVPEYDAWYYWTIDEQNISDTVYPGEKTFIWNTTGKKNIHLSTDGKNGCYDESDTVISIHEMPVAIIENDNNHLCFGKKFHLSTPEGSRYTYAWSPPQYFSNNNSPSVTGTAERTDIIYLTVTNQWQCSAYDSVHIYGGPCCDIFMPDVFTPNNDGRNDLYRAVDILRHKPVHFMIANRWGQIVYQAEGRNNGWDGTFKGAPAPQGTYSYYIKYICDDTEELTKKGTFILIR